MSKHPDDTIVLDEMRKHGRGMTSRGIAKELRWRHKGASISQSQPDRYRVERALLRLVDTGKVEELRAMRGSRWRLKGGK
jgi:hypothetical protein